jgi:hypothetical protein
MKIRRLAEYYGLEVTIAVKDGVSSDTSGHGETVRGGA